MKIINIVGARPNFMKVAPVHEAFLRAGHEALLVHTGQHYDEKMSEVFFDELGMPRPQVNLAVGSGSHAQQTARVMEAVEPVLLQHQPDWLLVAGDVNSTIACALVASKLGVRVAHLEAGLRSFDRSMPEEINRLLTDQISDLLLTPSEDADENLLREGIAPWRIKRVGNAMIDSLRHHAAKAQGSKILRTLGRSPQDYALITLHRPANVDSPAVLHNILQTIVELSHLLAVVFPLHPRTAQRIEQFGLANVLPQSSAVQTCKPLGYLDFLALQTQAGMVLTDSGGIQEETTALAVPCLTMRENTERPITISLGTNTLVGKDRRMILSEAQAIIENGGKKGRVPPLWDGNTGARVVAAVAEFMPLAGAATP